MARAAKTGLEYFPFDVDTFQDIRVRQLIKCQGGKAISVYTLLLCNIYKNGYYILWDDELLFICSELSGFGKAFITEVIKSCLTLGLFNKNLFDKEGVLTSQSIQTRYCNIQRLNKRIKRIDKYCLLDEVVRPRANVIKQSQPSLPLDLSHVQTNVGYTNTTRVMPDTANCSDSNDWIEQFFDDAHGEQLRLLCKNYGMESYDVDKLRKLANDVMAEWKLTDKKHYNYFDWSSHLISAMRIKYRATMIRQAVKHKAQTLSATSAAQPCDYSFNGGFGGQDI